MIDAKGMIVLPGLIDVHVHFREPGDIQKEDFLTGSRAAAAGGVTTVLDMPNNKPPITNAAALEDKRELAKKSIVNYGFYFGATSNNIDEIKKAKNIAGVKTYMGSSTGNLLVTDDSALGRIFSSGELIAVHAEDEEMMLKNAERYKNEHNAEIHGKVRSQECAAAAVKKAVDIAKKYNTKLHICHSSTEEEMRLIAAAKKDANISCEVTPHHLFLTAAAMRKLGNFAKMNPPLRSKSDVEALWKGISRGVVDIIATDHAPHTIEEKEVDYWKAPSGVPGVETMLPLLLNAVNNNILSLQQLVKLTSENPAERFGIKNKGKIIARADADLVIVDMKKEKTIKNSEIVSKCAWTPFDGWKVKGRVIATIANGEIIYRSGEFIEVKAKEVKYGA
jgi:dihydroorotase